MHVFRNPNVSGAAGAGPAASRETHRYRSPEWPLYDAVYKRYLDLGKC